MVGFIAVFVKMGPDHLLAYLSLFLIAIWNDWFPPLMVRGVSLLPLSHCFGFLAFIFVYQWQS